MRSSDCHQVDSTRLEWLCEFGALSPTKMTGDTDCESESGAKDEKFIGFQCCVKKNCSVCVCINCFAIYHSSCVKRNGKIKTIIDDTKIVCCNSDLAGSESYESKLFKIEKEKMNMEIEYLKKLLEEISEKNDILLQNNGLLIEKIANLENGQQKQTFISTDSEKLTVPRLNSSTMPMPPESSHSSLRSVVVSPSKRSRRPTATGTTYGGKVSAATNTQSRQRQPALTSARAQQANKEKEEEEETDTNVNENVGNNNKSGEIFTYQRHQRKKQYRKRLGNAETSPDAELNGFSGGERKVWLYLNRVRRHVNEGMIADYIKEKQGFQGVNVGVKELPGDPGKLKCFVVTAPLDKKDELYDPSFWPRGVGIKRFVFSKHQDFLKSSRFF